MFVTGARLRPSLSAASPLRYARGVRRNDFVWWPKFWLRPHGLVHNLVFLSEPGHETEMFLLEFPEGPHNRPEVALPRIHVPAGFEGSLIDLVKREAAHRRLPRAA